MWTTIIKAALKVAALAIAQVPASQWAQLGVIITNWINDLVEKLPAGHPFTVVASSCRAPRAKMTPSGDEHG